MPLYLLPKSLSFIYSFVLVAKHAHIDDTAQQLPHLSIRSIDSRRRWLPQSLFLTFFSRSNLSVLKHSVPFQKWGYDFGWQFLSLSLSFYCTATRKEIWLRYRRRRCVVFACM